jgi:alkyl sulfatase BDS1-like metallo-beta-lactamase superfamily hydrolase
LVAAAGAQALIDAARSHVAQQDPVRALHLTDIVLAVEPANAGARKVATDAHEALLADAENFWERAWLTKSIDELRATE